MVFDWEGFADQVGDAILAVDREGRIIVWNPGARRLFGFTNVDALGQSLDLIIPFRYRERHWRGFRQVIQSGQTRLGHELLRVWAIDKADVEIRIELTVGVTRDASGEITAIGAVLRKQSEPAATRTKT